MSCLFFSQEEELDDLAGQVQMLEQAKTKLEMSMAAMKKEHRRELRCLNSKFLKKRNVRNVWESV